MDQNEIDVFTFIWNIENFSMCPQRKGEKIVSSTFTVEAFGTAKWSMILFPRGNLLDAGQWVSCYLERKKGEGDPEEVTITCQIALVQANKSPSYVFYNENSIKTLLGHQFSVDIGTLQECKDDYLPNDVLTVLCLIKVGPQTSKKITETKCVSQSFGKNLHYELEEICTAVSDDKMLTEQFLYQCSSCTRIPIHRKEITWIIQNFKEQMQSGKKVSFSFVSRLREKSTIILNCYLTGDWNSDGTVKIDIQRKDKEFKQMFVKGKLSVLHKNDDVQESKKDKHLFGEGYEVWSFSPFIKTSKIENDEFLNDGALTIKCEFLISYIGEEVTTGVTSLQIIHCNRTSELNRGLIRMFNNLELIDATLISKGLQLFFHKSVLCAWSPVFTAMFKSDTKEKRTGIVYITDVDFSTLSNMRRFMYYGCIRDLEPEDAMKLYSAADKYEIPELKKQCAYSLKYNLSLSNVCEVLVLADLHKNAELLKYIYDFLRVHSQNVFASTEWTNLMEINLKLAGNTMREVLVMGKNS